jgi:hypothetical protein
MGKMEAGSEAPVVNVTRNKIPMAMAMAMAMNDTIERSRPCSHDFHLGIVHQLPG